MPIYNGIINQKGTPAFYSDIFANRPAFGYAGRVFISTDTGAIYEDTGTAWTLIADAGAGTTGTLQQVTTNGNTTTLPIIVNGINIGTGTGSTPATNTAIGTSASLLNTSGTHNASFGYESMKLNTTGVDNTSIGYRSLASNTIGTTNTAIGAHALENLVNSISNSALGYLALQFAINENNTGVGAFVGLDLTTGINNLFLGYKSGWGITTGSNNTIIGTITGLSATLSNNIVLSDGAGNVRLFSDANGLIGINQAVGSVPGGQLDIHTSQTYALVLNGLSTSNAYTAFSNASVGKWRIGNTYNAGANTFDIFNLGTSATALSFNATTNNATFNANLLIGSNIDDTINKLQVTGSAIVSTQFTLGKATAATNVSFDINGVANKAGRIRFQESGSNVWLIGNGAASENGRFEVYDNINGTGVQLLRGATAWIPLTSDIRLKKNFETTQGLNEILKIEPVKYHLLNEDDNTIKKLGFKAQNLQSLIPEMVVTNGRKADDGSDYLTIIPDYLLPVLVKAIQELNEKLERNNIN